MTVRAAEMPRDLAAVQDLCWAYRDYLRTFDETMARIVEIFYPLDGYAALMADLPARHARPRGIVMLAETEGAPVGCGMYHPLNAQDCEIKRVFVREEARGSGAGERLSRALVAQARMDGYARVLLDTNARFSGARKLYGKLGFRQRGPYSDVPAEALPHLVFYELCL